MAEEVAKPPPRDRKANFSVAECNLLSERVVEELSLIRGKHNNNVTNEAKSKIWKKITEEINALGVCERSEGEVRNKWRNMCRGAKSKYTYEKQQRNKTGGGPPSNVINNAEEVIINAMKDTSAFKGIDGGEETRISFDMEQPSKINRSLPSIWQNALDRCISGNDHDNLIQTADEADAGNTFACNQSPDLPIQHGPILDTPPSPSSSAHSKRFDVCHRRNRYSCTNFEPADYQQASSDESTASKDKQRRERISIRPPAKKSKKTAEDVYQLQCAVLERELVKTNLQIKLLEKLNNHFDKEENANILFSILN